MATTPAQTLSRDAASVAVSPVSGVPGAPPKPLLRGVSHQIAFFLALAASWFLVRSTVTVEAARAAFVFGASLVTLFGTSALYHRVDWSPAARRRMRRADHAAIFILIAGGDTPLFALVPSGTTHGHAALVVIWVGALVGVVKSLAWPHAPKWLTALLCVGLGWAVVGPVVDRASVIGVLPIAMLVVSGTTYSLGAVVYALKRPDPFPHVFGYHEVFHLIVVIASGCLFAHVLLVLRAV
jgi:hemolysin III